MQAHTAYISVYLPRSSYISLHLPVSPYISALQAHTAYFDCPDVAAFIVRRVCAGGSIAHPNPNPNPNPDPDPNPNLNPNPNQLLDQIEYTVAQSVNYTGKATEPLEPEPYP